MKSKGYDYEAIPNREEWLLIYQGEEKKLKQLGGSQIIDIHPFPDQKSINILLTVKDQRKFLSSNLLETSGYVAIESHQYERIMKDGKRYRVLVYEDKDDHCHRKLALCEFLKTHDEEAFTYLNTDEIKKNSFLKGLEKQALLWYENKRKAYFFHAF